MLEPCGVERGLHLAHLVLRLLHGLGCGFLRVVQSGGSYARQHLSLKYVLADFYEERVDIPADACADAHHVLWPDGAVQCDSVLRNHCRAGRLRGWRPLAKLQREHGYSGDHNHRSHGDKYPFSPHTQC